MPQKKQGRRRKTDWAEYSRNRRERMKAAGFVFVQVEVHSEDADRVRTFAKKLRQEREEPNS